MNTNGSPALDPNAGLADLYTRFLLVAPNDATGVLPGGGQNRQLGHMRSYRAERPNIFARIFTEEERAVVAVARITLLDPNMEMTIPLYSVSYNSGGEGGEAWATTVTSSYVRSPLFRINGNSRFAVNVTTNTSDETQSSGFSTAISALSSVVDLVAPQASVLTDLNSEENRARATALDGAISELLSYSISEEIEFGRMLNSWSRDAAISFSGCAPFVRGGGDANRARGGSGGDRSNLTCANDRDIDGQQNHFIGTWRLQIGCPQFSVFSPRSLCKSDGSLESVNSRATRNTIHTAIAATVSDSLVLEQALGTNATVRSRIRGGDFFIQFIAEKTRTTDLYGRFCASTMDSMRQVGLNGLDAALSLRAALRMMPEFVQDRDTPALTASCQSLVQDYGVTLRS